MSLLTEKERKVLLEEEVQEPDVKLTHEISPRQLDWRNSPKIHLWTRQNGLLTENDQRAWKEKISQDPTIKMFGIEGWTGTSPLGMDNVGTCGLTSINMIHRSAEFSLLIGPEFQKRGFGKSALKALFRYGFDQLQLHSIWGETFEDNPAFLMFMKLGMRKEGKVKERYFKNGKYKDAYIVSILDREARRQSWFYGS